MEERDKIELITEGVAASGGIALGRVFVHIQTDVAIQSYRVDASMHKAEVARFDHAILATRQQIQKIQDEVEKNLGADEARIFDAHLMVVEDQALIGETIREMESSGLNIEACFQKISQRYIKAFDEIDDEYLRERAGDIRDVAQRLLQNLLGQAGSNLTKLTEKRIVVGNDITPSDAASIDRGNALGIVTDSGSKTSHAVIVARSMRIPAVVGLRDLSKRVQNGDWILVDGYDGKVILNPSEATLFLYGKLQKEREGQQQRLIDASKKPSVTLDGVAISLRANIEKSDEIALVKECSGDGVGLFRTEFLYMGAAQLPGEEEQYKAYKAVAEAFPGSQVVIRTLDLGGDKPLAGHAELFQPESNPFLGYRAIRFCLENKDIFKHQLRAILRSSAHGPVSLMYPMISGCEELARANEILDECRRELRAEKIAFNEKMPVGTMIEIPSAAIVADLLAKKCDFFSIGTNDLIQYLIAIDRVNDRIAHLYEPTHPAVLRTLRQIVDAARKEGIKVSVCGEMAGDPVYVPLLLGLGVDELSMTPPLIPAAKFLVRALKLSDVKRMAEKALTMESPKEIYAMFETFCRERLDMVKLPLVE